MNEKKIDCYKCIFKSFVPGSCHSSCIHPEVTKNPEKLNIEGHQQGIRGGWFYWPSNFDPIWLKNCDGFKKKGDK